VHNTVTGGERGFYGYTVAAAASLIMVLVFTVHYAFGVFFKPVLTEFGWTRAMTSGAFSLVWISQGLVGILMGGLNDRFGPRLVLTACGALIGGGFLLTLAWAYEKFTGVEGMGGGDIKLLAMIGAFLGWQSIPLTLFFASLSGSVVGISCMLAKGVGRRFALPFAPFLCLGALLHLFFGRDLIWFYLN